MEDSINKIARINSDNPDQKVQTLLPINIFQHLRSIYLNFKNLIKNKTLI